ncbi:MAG: hypothetical protein V3W31_04520, partial [Thermodesulfobacteriota bacterium]
MLEITDANYHWVLAAFLIFVVATSIPAGYLRGRYPKFSRPWARCLYIPIVINIIIRRVVGLSFATV